MTRAGVAIVGERFSWRVTMNAVHDALDAGIGIRPAAGRGTTATAHRSTSAEATAARSFVCAGTGVGGSRAVSAATSNRPDGEPDGDKSRSPATGRTASSAPNVAHIDSLVNGAE